MGYALHVDDSTDGRLFEVDDFTQRLVTLAGPGGHESCDEVLYVLDGDGTIDFGDGEQGLRPGTAVFAPAGSRWTAAGTARAVSVLVHDPLPASGNAVLDLDAVEKSTATAGRQFVLGATPECGCASVTQFIGLVPPGRAPDHFHRYDEVIYILEGEGLLAIGGEETPIRAGSCIHLPRTLVHCLANTGESELRLLGVFRPAGSPAEAYYPDGTLAAVPGSES
jgi:mannose-6-phosphate isomerase-like protein (cupin superfamily)